MARLFVALELSGEIRDRLKGVQGALRTGPARLTLVDPPLIHITLKFLGEVPEQEIPRVSAALSSIPFRPFPVTVGAVALNNPKRPRTVWCTVSDGGNATELFGLVEGALAPLGFGRETRAFTPHATLARVKVPDPSLSAIVRGLMEASYGTCTIPGMKLKKSTLTPRGPVYEDLLEVAW